MLTVRVRGVAPYYEEGAFAEIAVQSSDGYYQEWTIPEGDSVTLEIHDEPREEV